MEDDEGAEKIVEKAEFANIVGSEEMEHNISQILQKIEHFTDLVTIFKGIVIVVDQKGKIKYNEQKDCL